MRIAAILPQDTIGSSIPTTPRCHSSSSICIRRHSWPARIASLIRKANRGTGENHLPMSARQLNPVCRKAVLVLTPLSTSWTNRLNFFRRIERSRARLAALAARRVSFFMVSPFVHARARTSERPCRGCLTHILQGRKLPPAICRKMPQKIESHPFGVGPILAPDERHAKPLHERQATLPSGFRV